MYMYVHLHRFIYTYIYLYVYVYIYIYMNRDIGLFPSSGLPLSTECGPDQIYAKHCYTYTYI